MLKWEIKNNVISSLLLNDVNVINPWGIETADSYSFFSMEKGIGYRYEVLNEKTEATTNLYKTCIHIKMKEGEWILNTSDEIIGNKIVRTAELLCMEDSWFMDFVVRFRFSKSFYSQAFINNKKIIHQSSNIYYQFKTDEARLESDNNNNNNNNNNNVLIKTRETDCAFKMTPYLYVRDHKDEWVVHARMLPNVEDKGVIKLCSHYFKTLPLPEKLTKHLLRIPCLKKYLHYRNEHTPYKSKVMKFFSPNAFSLVLLKKGERLFWKVEAEFCE